VAIAREIQPRFSWAALRGSLRYGVPTAAAVLIDVLALSLDRVFLDKYVNLAQLGLYNLANQLASAFNVFNQALKTSWFPFLYRAKAEREDVAELLGRFSVVYLAALAVPALAVALFAREFIDWFGAERYRGVYPFVPFFVLHYYIYAIAAAIGRGMDLAKRTELWPLIPAGGIAVGLVTLWLLVPAWGVWGAIAGVLAGGVTRAAIQIGLSLHYFPRPLYLGRLVSVAALALGAFACGFVLAPQSPWAGFVVKSIIIGACTPLLLWIATGRPHPRAALAMLLARKAS
jgi:O-antigen/teichoic acid export membrane protein